MSSLTLTYHLGSVGHVTLRSVANATWEQVEFSMLPRPPLQVLRTGTRFCCPSANDGVWNVDPFRSLDNFVTCNHFTSVVILGAKCDLSASEQPALMSVSRNCG